MVFKFTYVGCFKIIFSVVVPCFYSDRDLLDAFLEIIVDFSSDFSISSLTGAISKLIAGVSMMYSDIFSACYWGLFGYWMFFSVWAFFMLKFVYLLMLELLSMSAGGFLPVAFGGLTIFMLCYLLLTPYPLELLEPPRLPPLSVSPLLLFAPPIMVL